MGLGKSKNGGKSIICNDEFEDETPVTINDTDFDNQ